MADADVFSGPALTLEDLRALSPEDTVESR
jgi:hypothetical protein